MRIVCLLARSTRCIRGKNTPDARRKLGEDLLNLAYTASPRAALITGNSVTAITGIDKKTRRRLASSAQSAQESHGAEIAIHLDATGIDALFRSEAGFAGAIDVRAQRKGLSISIGIASSRFIAHLAARATATQPGTTCIVSPGEETSFLAPLPLEILHPSAALRQKLLRFGMEHIGDLTSIPLPKLSTRLGQEALLLASLLRGECIEAPLPAPKEAQVLEEHLDLENAIDNLEPFRFTFQGLASRLLERLATHGLACEQMQLKLRLEGGVCKQYDLHSGAPSSNPKAFVRAAIQQLEKTPPGAAIEQICLHAQGVPFENDQLDFFRIAGPAPKELHSVVAELENQCGPGRVGYASLISDYRPDAFTLTPVSKLKFSRRAGATRTTPSETSTALHSPLSEHLPELALRMLRPPMAAHVRSHGERPHWIESAIANGELHFVSGPWRTAGRWWCGEERFAFDHFDVQTSDGTLLRLRHDRLHKRWEIDALYD